MQQLAVGIIELLVGLLTIYGVRQRNSSGVTIKDLIKELEERDKEIERLKIAKHTWQMRYEALKHLHT